MFKKNITPEWEDKANAEGCQLDAHKYLSAEALDIHWENLVLGLIGETIDENDNICGFRMVNQNKKGKANCKFEIWLRRKDQETATKLRSNIIDALADGNAKVKPTFKIMEEDFAYYPR